MSSKKRVLNSIMLIRYIIWWNKEIIFGLTREWKQSESSEKCVDFVCFTWYLSLIIAKIFLLFFHYFLIIFSFTKAGMLTLSKLSYVLYFIIICWMGLSKKMCYLYQDNVTLKTQEALGPRHSPAKEFQSINTFAQSNDYAIALWDKPSPSPFEGSKVDHLKKISQLCAKIYCVKFGRNSFNGSACKRRFFNFIHIFLLFHLPLEKVESDSPWNVMCQVWLNSVQWFWRKK